MRNPNLNLTATNTVIDESEISTPLFIEDSILNNKIDLLVNKLVASMQVNLDNLVDIVYERKNVSLAGQIISNYNKNGTASKPVKVSDTKVTTKKPARPINPKPTTKKQATTSSPITKRPTTKPTVTKKPQVTTTTKKPARKPVEKPTTTTEKSTDEDEVIEEEDAGNSDGIVDDPEVDQDTDDSTVLPIENGRIRKKSFVTVYLWPNMFYNF